MTVVTVSSTSAPDPVQRRTAYARSLMGIYGATMLALGAAFGPYVEAGALLILSFAFVSGWPIALGLTNTHAARVTLGLVVFAALGAATFGTLTTTTFVAVLAIFGVFLTEMFRRDGRAQLIEHISATLAGAMIVVSGSLWIHAAELERGPDVIIVSAITLAVVALMHAFETSAARVVGFINGIFFGAGTAFIVQINLATGLIIGLSVGLLYTVSARAVEALEPAGKKHLGTTRAMFPLLALGIIGYLLAAYLV
ncbi:MAG: hypothetical protein GX483_00485 [Actinomycetaceae bacterium]|nr:hypothetical protein [Actinomycetaceae bacterium]